MKTYYSSIPEKILYMEHNGYADCWLRKNIEMYRNEDESGFVADEVYIKTLLSYDEVEKMFDTLFENPTVEKQNVTIEERIEAIEEAILELAMRGGTL